MSSKSIVLTYFQTMLNYIAQKFVLVLIFSFEIVEILSFLVVIEFLILNVVALLYVVV